MNFQDTTIQEIDRLMQEAWQAFVQYRKTTLKQRADLMRAIAAEMEALGDELIRTAMEETHLPEARLKGERARTIFQLTSYGAACEAGNWLEARIDTAAPGQPGPRQLRGSFGAVAVFCARNFPFLFLLSGGG